MEKDKVSAREKAFSKYHYENAVFQDVGEQRVPITWEIVDEATFRYAELLKDFDFGEIIKSMISRYDRKNVIQVLPMAGNIDYSDQSLKFDSFYTLLESSREFLTKKAFASDANMKELKRACAPVIQYIISGKHDNKEKAFSGYKKTLDFAVSKKRKALIGVLSVDIPEQVSSSKNGQVRYRPSGTQHYVSYMYEVPTKSLFIFDSASKNACKDMSEIYFILKFVFEELVGVSVSVKAVEFPFILQPGAGDRKTENERSYNNQNVFCHTWSLWFGTLLCMFYDGKRRMEDGGFLKFFTSCAHKDTLLNLCMIKRFAYWLVDFLAEEADSKIMPTIPIRAFEKAQRDGDKERMKAILSTAYAHAFLYEGLKYAWNYKTNMPISVEDLCVAKEIKFDIKYADAEIDEYTLEAFDELLKRVRCKSGYEVNKSTNRCRKIKKNGK